MSQHVMHAYNSTQDQAYQQPVSPALPHLVYIKATVRGLHAPIVPFALLYNDPLAEFRQGLELFRRMSGETGALGVGMLRDAWNEQFAELRPEQQFFVYAWSSVQGASPAVAGTSGLLCQVATPGPQQRRWFATRPVWRKGELVAWCQTIDLRTVTADQVTIVTLSEERMLRLVPSLLYDDLRIA